MAKVNENVKNVLDYAFYPRSIAVAGASEQPISAGYNFLRHLIDDGYKGDIYPINLKHDTVLGIKAYRTLGDVPSDVDLVICCLPAGLVLPLLDECPGKNVKVMHLFTARMKETGRQEGVALEEKVRLKAKKLGVRLIGPNCMGIYCPSSGISFGYGFPHDPGGFGLVFQSGGAASLVIADAALQGLRFSKVVSYGNGLDIDESDLLDYFAADDDTRIIGAYFEGIKNGPRFCRALKAASKKKPVIAIKGGRGQAGARAVASHTAAIAGSVNTWDVAFRQAGAIQVKDIVEMMDVAMLFNWLPPVRGNRVGIMGGGGGKGVMSADLAEDAGLLLPPLSSEIRTELKEIVPDLWDWLGNPVDFSIWGDNGTKAGDIPRLFLSSSDFDFLIVQISDENPTADEWWAFITQMEVEGAINMARQKSKPVIATLSSGKPGFRDLDNVRWRTISEYRTKLIDAGVPTFDEIGSAVRTMSKFINYWKRH
jgi:acyl-CoA synthetase (NDP forming)